MFKGILVFELYFKVGIRITPLTAVLLVYGKHYIRFIFFALSYGACLPRCLLLKIFELADRF